MKLKYTITVLLLLFTASLLKAQVTTITGNVKDETGEPLPGCNIVLENVQRRAYSGTITNFDGNYRLNVPGGQNLTVVFSFIGYKSQRVSYTGQSKIDITLQPDDVALDDIVVTSQRGQINTLGLTKKEVVSSSQTFRMDDMESKSTLSIEEAIQGRLANVDIVSGGDPGSRSSIRIRGTASLNSNAEPLIVIDGIPYPTNIEDDFNFATANDEDFGALVNISPADIESIEVLKDAAATAIWGSKGANGVLIFTTKKGRSGKTRFSFSSKMGFNREPNTIPMLDSKQYVSMVQDALWNSVNDLGYQSGIGYLSYLYNTSEINFDPSWEYFDEYNQETDWMSEVTQTGFSTDNNFSMSGGGDKATYRFSLGYLNELGTTIGTDFERFNTMISLNYRFSDKFRINADFSYSQSVRNSNWTKKDFSGARSEAMKKMPNMSPYVIGEDGERTDEYFTPIQNFQGSWNLNEMYNPVALAHESINRTGGRNGRVVFAMFYDVLPGLQYQGRIGLDMRTTKNKKLLPNVVSGVRLVDDMSNLASDNLSDKMYITTENKLIYRKTFAEVHKIIFTGIFQTYEGRSSSYSSSSSGTASSSLADPTGGAVVAGIGSGSSLTRNLGFIGNAHYTFNEKYIISAGYRQEANSSMGKNTRWGGFPTVGLAWHFGDESFVQDLGWVNIGKLRYSWGQAGNAPGGAYPYIGTFNALNENYISMPAIEPNKIQLDNLKWETVTQTNIGVDLEMLDNRLRITAEAYNKVTTDLLQKDIGIPSTTGYSSVKWYNSGSMTNTGFEFIAAYDMVRNKDFRFTVDFNISRNVNEVVELPDNKQFENYTFGNRNFAHKVVEGNPLGSFYGYKCLGVYQNVDETYARDLNGNIINDIAGESVIMANGTTPVYPGDAKYADVNGDGVIDKYDIVYIGNAMPLFTGGISLNLRYKDFTLSSFFHGRFGNKVVNATRMNTENMRGANNQSTAVLKRWRHEGDDTMIPRALYGRGYNTLGSDRFVEDGSFVRLKTLSLKYSLPKTVLNNWGVDRFDIWVTGYDLFTWTKYTGQDPEVSLSNNIYMLSVDKSSTPKPRRFALGVTLNF
ncbi:MAG: TonB-dependent receptor [Prolixibacteraceae bacterium]|jgi:TonB-linked SusC/RagA family outer membrane protein|nr:TonB-dependent receptor [Prolixibacteraceae bacterium]